MSDSFPYKFDERCKIYLLAFQKLISDIYIPLKCVFIPKQFQEDVIATKLNSLNWLLPSLMFHDPLLLDQWIFHFNTGFNTGFSPQSKPYGIHYEFLINAFINFVLANSHNSLVSTKLYFIYSLISSWSSNFATKFPQNLLKNSWETSWLLFIIQQDICLINVPKCVVALLCIIVGVTTFYRCNHELMSSIYRQCNASSILVLRWYRTAIFYLGQWAEKPTNIWLWGVIFIAL